MYCRKCGENIGLERECPKCDTAAGYGNKYCPECGKKTGLLACKCKHCGTFFNPKSREQDADYLNGHNKYLMALIALFFGGIGLHCFIIGNPKRGLFRIVFTLIFGWGILIAILDAIFILRGQYNTEPDGLFEMALW